MSKGIPHLKSGKRFAETFVRTILGWAKPGFTIGSRMHVGVIDRLTVFKFSLNIPCEFFQTVDQGIVTKMVNRAAKIAPAADPQKGDLAVFDGRHILMFRRFDEVLSIKNAKEAAREVAGYIIMQKEERRTTPSA